MAAVAAAAVTDADEGDDEEACVEIALGGTGAFSRRRRDFCDGRNEFIINVW